MNQIAQLIHYLNSTVAIRDFCLLNSNDHAHQYNLLCGYSTTKKAVTNNWPTLGNAWQFGFFGYDLKNRLEKLNSANSDKLSFPDLYFFEAETVLAAQKQGLLNCVFNENEKKINPQQLFSGSQPTTVFLQNEFKIRCRVSKQEYIETIKKLKAHIQAGDIYELNYCIEFYAEDASIDPFTVYTKLNAISAAPFSAFARLGGQYILCSSPERFLKKSGHKLISQPIKGTRTRVADPEKDAQLKEELRNDLKEQTENVMIVDIVRNDLSKVAKRSSVKVDELFGVYSFEQVHQLISTVSCELRPELQAIDAIKAAFPMGSMTGAPKIRAMELIEQYERTKRGTYSGALGYSDPAGDFDLNVIIRTILYNPEKKYLSFMVGSAITANCDPEKEYEECMIKARALFAALGQEYLPQ